MLQYQPSIICASAVYLALKTHGQTPWVRTACALSGAFASLPAPFPPPPRLSPSHTHYPPTSPLPCLPAPPCLRAFHAVPPSPLNAVCGAGTADRSPSEAFELHGGRPSGLCRSPSANPNPNPTQTNPSPNPTSPVPLPSCVRDIHDIHVGAWINSLQAVRKKYAKPEFGFISNIPPLTSTV